MIHHSNKQIPIMLNSFSFICTRQHYILKKTKTKKVQPKPIEDIYK